MQEVTRTLDGLLMYTMVSDKASHACTSCTSIATDHTKGMLQGIESCLCKHIINHNTTELETQEMYKYGNSSPIAYSRIHTCKPLNFNMNANLLMQIILWPRVHTLL